MSASQNAKRLAKLEQADGGDLKPCVVTISSEGDDLEPLKTAALFNRFGKGPYPDVEWVHVHLVPLTPGD
jgi:hypothetical protein